MSKPTSPEGSGFLAGSFETDARFAAAYYREALGLPGLNSQDPRDDIILPSILNGAVSLSQADMSMPLSTPSKDRLVAANAVLLEVAKGLVPSVVERCVKAAVQAELAVPRRGYPLVSCLFPNALSGKYKPIAPGTLRLAWLGVRLADVNEGYMAPASPAVSKHDPRSCIGLLVVGALTSMADTDKQRGEYRLPLSLGVSPSGASRVALFAGDAAYEPSAVPLGPGQSYGVVRGRSGSIRRI